MKHGLALLIAAAFFLASAPEVRSEVAKILVCHGGGQSASGHVMQLPNQAIRGHLGHGDCRITGNAPLGLTCDRSHVDAGGFCASRSTNCGDGAGAPGAGDLPCYCGDTVVTNTTLNLGFDPVASTMCSANGLTLAHDVQLDLNGLTLSGNGAGNGLSIPHGGAAQGGTVRGFGTGIRVAIETAGSLVTVAGIVIENNAGVGALIEAADSQSRIVFSGVTVQGNGADGVHVRAVPGASNLDDATADLESADYGFVLRLADIRNNAGHGIHLGDAVQPADVAALIGGAESSNEVSRNLGAGILLEQASGLAPGADCGASAGQPGCTGATLAGNVIHDNAGAGVELRAGFIIPLFVAGAIEHGLGFVGNEVNHNAMAGSGCTAPQTLPQIHVTGPVGLSDAPCNEATSNAACESRNSPVNRHCTWAGFSCRVAWDIRGDVSSMCNNGLVNAIFDYNTSDTGNFDSVGLRAINDAIVNADNNVWRSADTTQNVTQAPGAFVRSELICSTRGTCLSP